MFEPAVNQNAHVVFQNPLYLHPCDEPCSLTIQEKLVGSQNCRPWHRAIEIGLSIKRKLRFIRGIVARLSIIVLNYGTCKEEQRLLRFLNGLDKHYGNLRTQLLLMVPLPSVENACSMLQHKESQRVLFGSSSFDFTTLYNKGVVKNKCTIYGFKWHPPEKCWEKVGYPAWYPKLRLNANKQFKRNGQHKNQFALNIVAHVESDNLSFTPQQFD
nr:cysteine-rich RLK (receptor-like protein kinase) 8 [Tanacetum cinerariifolium]